MNIQNMILAIYNDNSLEYRQNKIRQMSSQIMQQMSHLDELQKSQTLQQQKHLFQAFFKVIEKVVQEVKQAKKKYQSIDKQQLKYQKCSMLAKDIKLFKEQCFYLRNQVNDTKKQLKDIRIQNQLLEQEQYYMQKVHQSKQQQKNRLKSRNSAILWRKNEQQSNKQGQLQASVQKQVHSSNKKNIRNTFSSLQTQSKKDNNQNHLYIYSHKRYSKSISRNKSKTNTSNIENIYKRLIATSQQPRKFDNNFNNYLDGKISQHKQPRRSYKNLKHKKKNISIINYDQF